MEVDISRSMRRAGATQHGTRLDWVDTGRGIAITLVALFHATNWVAGTGIDVAFWSDLSAVLSSLRMPLFFVLSGLFAAKWLTATWRDLLRTKVLLFLWVLIVWSVIGMTIQWLGLRAAGQPLGILPAVRDLLLSPVNPPFELWFIWALALFFVVAKATRRVPFAVQLVVAGLISAAALTVWLTMTTGLTGSAKYYFFFLFGLYLRSVILRFGSARIWLHVLVLLGWAVISTTLFVLDARDLPGVYFLNCVVGVFAGIVLSRALSGVLLLRFLGRETLPIYLAHTPVVILITIIMLLVPPVLSAAEHIAWVMPPLVACVSIAAAVGIHRLALRAHAQFLYRPPQFAVRLFGGSQ